jgi:hypothetical protein
VLTNQREISRPDTATDEIRGWCWEDLKSSTAKLIPEEWNKDPDTKKHINNAGIKRMLGKYRVNPYGAWLHCFD